MPLAQSGFACQIGLQTSVLNTHRQMSTSLRFKHRGDLSQILGNRKIISSGAGPNGEAAILAVTPDLEKEPFGREEQEGFASFPLSKARKPYPALFMRFDGEVIQETELHGVDSAFPFIQPLPNGEILVVGGRCHYRKGNPEKNASVYAPDGRLSRQFVLGDGINGVQTTSDGTIWVSYFDEGVFGNFGWDKPLGSSGLVCFDPTGEIVWEFQPPDGVDAIADCYAFNVAEDSVWACYYTEFPVVKIDSKKKVWAWKNNIPGANAIVADRGRVLLWGGYGEQRSSCMLQEINGEVLETPLELTPSLPPGFDFSSTSFVGRGSVLHAFSGNHWLTFDLAGSSKLDT